MLPSRYVMIAGEWMRNIGKLLIPYSGRILCSGFFIYMLGSILLKASPLSCEVFEVADNFSNSYSPLTSIDKLSQAINQSSFFPYYNI